MVAEPTTATLIAAAPALFGNLNGVGISDRIAANRLHAAQHEQELNTELTATDLTPSQRTKAEREREYFHAVADGSKQLYAWDHEQGSLIEVTGDPAIATSALFVVPGTGTTEASFQGDHPVTGFAEWQARSSSAVLAFTVLTGPMPQLSLVGIVDNGPQNNHFATDRAPEYANFVRGVKAASPDLWTMSYEHSYGGGICSAAEAYGGTVDTQFMAGSVGAVGPYEPDPATTYYAAQAADDINRAYAGVRNDEWGFDIGPEDFPGVHIVDSGIPGADPAKLKALDDGDLTALGGIIKDKIDHHNAPMSDDEDTNGTLLQTIARMLKRQGSPDAP